MLAIGCPIMGDGKYGGQAVFAEGFSKKLHLHAFSLDCKELGISAIAELPEHMEKL
jgi:23S rRNA pseudouridine955/2504/2580 synthase